MTRHTWTALVSAVVFVALALTLVVVPVPFVAWGPGGVRDTLGEVDGKPLISVAGIPTYPTAGRLDMTIVSVTPAEARLSLPQALLAYWMPSRDALPRDAVYAPRKTAAQVQSENAEMMETAQSDAVVAALRAAGEPVTEMPAVFSVTVGGPAHRQLRPGDLIVSVDGVKTPTVDAVRDAVRSHRVGERVRFSVIRDKAPLTVDVVTAESSAASDEPVVGIELVTGYSYRPQIRFDLGQRIGGPSAGLVFALAIYDQITPGMLVAGHAVAGTGQISPSGAVGAIGGIHEKIAAATKAGDQVFLVPAENCVDLAGLHTDLDLIKVATLDDAITAVRHLDTPGSAERMPRCPAQ